MEILDYSFDSGKGNIDVTLSGGVIGLKITEANPAFPSGAQVNIPLSVIFGAITAKVSNAFLDMMLNGVLALVSAIQ